MDRQVVHIYGASGSGTSTIGRFISNKLGYFFMDTDDYFWESTNPPYTIKRNVSDRIYDRGGLDMRSKSKHVYLWRRTLKSYSRICKLVLLEEI